MQKTTFATDPKDRASKWIVVDASGQILGRMASRIALILRGKHKVTFTPFIDMGDSVIVINAKSIRVTGQKLAQKEYRRYSGYPDGYHVTTLAEMLQKHPERVVTQAVKGMLPEGPLGRRLLGKLKVYPGAEHPHAAQQPETVSVS